MADLDTIRRSKTFRQRWTEILENLEKPPQRVISRDGQGLNLLLYSTGERFIHICISPADDPRGFSAKTPVASLRQVGDFPLLPEERLWLNVLTHRLPQFDDEEGWADYLNWTMDKPGISAGWHNTDRRTTSGHEVVIRLIESCNAACDFCGCIGTAHDYATRLEEVRGRLQGERKKGANRVVYTGGEPTLVPNLPELIALAKEEGFEWVNLQTNGVRLADEALTNRLAEAGLDSILLSLHSHDPEIHNSILKLDNAFEQALIGIENTIRAGIKVGLNFVINKENLHTLPGYMEFVHTHFSSVGLAMESRPIAVTMSFVSPVGWALEHLDQIPRLSDAAPIMAQALENADKLGLDVHVPGLCGVPMCMLPGYEIFFDEYRDENPPRLATRTYVDACDRCEFRSRCSGYWKVYMERYGEEEFGAYDDTVSWARPPQPEDTPELVSAVQGELVRLLGGEEGSLPDSVYQVPHHELACTLNREGVTTASGGHWTDERVEDFTMRHGLQKTLEKSLGWIVDGAIQGEETLYWLRTPDGRVVPLRDERTPDIFVAGDETQLRDLREKMDAHPQTEGAVLKGVVFPGSDDPCFVLRVRPRNGDAHYGLLRKIKKTAAGLIILNGGLPFSISRSSESPLLPYSKRITCTYGEDGQLLSAERVDGDEEIPAYRCVTLDVESDENGHFLGLQLGDDRLGQNQDDEGERLLDAIHGIRTVDPDVVVLHGGMEGLAGMMVRAQALEVVSIPGRDPIPSRPFRSLESWFQGRVIVDASQWEGEAELIETCARLGVWPRLVLAESWDGFLGGAGEFRMETLQAAFLE